MYSNFDHFIHTNMVNYIIIKPALTFIMLDAKGYAENFIKQMKYQVSFIVILCTDTASPTQSEICLASSENQYLNELNAAL